MPITEAPGAMSNSIDAALAAMLAHGSDPQLDQAHLTRECRVLTGLAPNEWVSAHRAY